MNDAPDELDQVPVQRIAKELLAGKVIPFLGAGASVFANQMPKPPSATALARALAEDNAHPSLRAATQPAPDGPVDAIVDWLAARAECENLSMVASWVEHVGGDRGQLRDTLRQYLAEQPVRPNALHRLIAAVAQVRPLVVITTNYDDLIEQALGNTAYDLIVLAVDRATGGGEGTGPILFRPAGGERLTPVVASAELLEFDLIDHPTRPGMKLRQLRRPVVFKIHGHISRTDETEDSFLITEEDYVAFLGRMGAGGLIPKELSSLMSASRFLFLGYSLRDWNLRVLLDSIHRVQQDKGAGPPGPAGDAMRSYAIARNVRPHEKQLWQQRRVNIANADLNAFVARLEQAIAALAPPPAAPPAGTAAATVP